MLWIWLPINFIESTFQTNNNVQDKYSATWKLTYKFVHTISLIVDSGELNWKSREKKAEKPSIGDGSVDFFFIYLTVFRSF